MSPAAIAFARIFPAKAANTIHFYHNAFLPADNGYSTIEDDLGSIAAKANLRSSGSAFKQKELKGRDVTEIDISDTVEGDYPAIIQFINGLEHSKNFYLLNNLRLQSPSSSRRWHPLAARFADLFQDLSDVQTKPNLRAHRLCCCIAAYAFTPNAAHGPGISGVLASDTTFHPLDVDEPHLRLDLLDKIKKLDYSGSHRNIFIFGPPPPPPKTAEQIARENYRAQGPQQPPPPPPVTVPAQLFGSALMSKTGKRVAFFLNGDEVLVVEEGGYF